MSIKDENEITVKVTSSKEKLIEILTKQGFSFGRTFSLDDYYFIPNDFDVSNTTTRDILAKAIIIRDIINDNGINLKLITYKIKQFDFNGDILNQKAINCNVYSIVEAKTLLKAIGYREVLNIKEKDVIYFKDKLELAIKEIINGDILIEIETEQNTDYDTVDKLKTVIESLEIPIEPNQYFVKKAEIELNKVLNR